MLNETLFSELVDSARDLPGNRWAVGGNAPVMAGRMANEGCDVLLGGSYSTDFVDVLPEHITGTSHNSLPQPGMMEPSPVLLFCLCSFQWLVKF